MKPTIKSWHDDDDEFNNRSEDRSNQINCKVDVDMYDAEKIGCDETGDDVDSGVLFSCDSSQSGVCEASLSVRLMREFL